MGSPSLSRIQTRLHRLARRRASALVRGDTAILSLERETEGLLSEIVGAETP